MQTQTRLPKALSRIKVYIATTLFGAGSLAFLGFALPPGQINKIFSPSKSLIGTNRVPSPPELICYDTDGGNNPEKNGTVTLRNAQTSSALRHATDTCVSRNVLREYYCSGKAKNFLEPITIAEDTAPCPTGTECRSGACAALR